MTIYPDMTERHYRALPGLSGTQVATILESPMLYRHQSDNPRQSTPAMGFGTIVHALVLDQPLPCIVSPYDSFRTKAAQEWKTEQEDDGLIVVTADVMDSAISAAESVLAHPVANALLAAPGGSEVSVTGEHRGQPLKGRIDRLPDVGPIVDLKTDRDITPRGMSQSIGDYGYATQLQHYAKLADRPEPAIIIAVENIAPYRVAVYRIDDLTWDLGRRGVELAWDLYADCIETDTWPSGLPDDITDIGLRPWAYDELEYRIDPNSFTPMELKL